MTTKRKHPFGLAEDRFSADRREAVIPMAACHAHSQIEINYFLSGRAHYIYNGKTVEVHAGEFVFFWGAVPHKISEAAEGTAFSCLYIPLERFMFSLLGAELKAAVLCGGFIRVRESLALDRLLFEQTRTELLRDDVQLSEINYAHMELRLRRVEITGWTNLFALQEPNAATPTKGHSKVVEMTRFISEHAGSDISTVDVASAVSLHPKYATTLFRGAVGITITQYLVRCRLVTAQRLLLAGQKSMTAIAFESGFGSVSRFYEAFQKQVGLSPRAFRGKYGVAER